MEPDISISGLTAFTPKSNLRDFYPPHPIYNGEEKVGEFAYQFWKAQVGQTFTVTVSLIDEAQASFGEWRQSGKGVGFASNTVAPGSIHTWANWTDDGVLVSYNVAGDLPEAPRIQLVWADSETTPETVAYEFVGQSFGAMPGGTTYEMLVPGGSLTAAPFLSGSLIVRVDPNQRLGASSNSLPFQADVRFAFEWFPPRKNEPYDLAALVANHTRGGVSIAPITMTLSEVRSQGATRSKDANPGPVQKSVTIPSLAAREEKVVQLGTFSHNWEWIPDENPIDKLLLEGEGLGEEIAGQVVGELLGQIRRAGWAAKIAWGLYTLTSEWGELIRNAERTNTYSYSLDASGLGTVASVDVVISVPDSRGNPLMSYVVARAFGIDQVWDAIQGKGSLALAVASLIGAKHVYDTAKDPPDVNFRETVELEYIFPAGPADTDRHWLVREITAHRFAAYRARNKADGARLAGDAEWESRQLSAAAVFAVEAARVERRLSILDMLYPQPAGEVDADDLARFTQRIATEGLPAEVVSSLRAGGFSESHIDGFRNLLASLTSLPVSSPETPGNSGQLLAMTSFLEGIEVLVESVRLKVTQPGAAVLPVSAAIIAELDAAEAAVRSGFEAELADDAHETLASAHLERVQDLLLATNNLPVLEPYLQRAATARVQLMARFIRTADVAAHIDQAVTAESADAVAAAAVKAELDRAAGAFAAGSHDTAAVAATVAEVVAARRGNGIPIGLADDITGWTASVSGKSRLAAESFVLEVGRSYDLDVLANDSTVAGRLVPGSLAIHDAAGLGNSVTVVDGKLRLNPTAAMAGRHTVRYSVFDDASYLRNSQAISLTVTTNGIFVSDGQITTDTTTRTGGYDLVKLGAGKLVLDRANTHSGGTVIGAGEVIVRNLAALGTGTVLVSPGARLTLDVGPGAVALRDLEIETGGLLDVGMGRFVLEAGSFNVATIRERIAAGFGSGSSGIASSAAAATSGRAVGHAVDGNGNLVVGFAAAGDLDMNGVVDVNDATALMTSGLFDTGLPATWAEGDYDYNGVLDMDDVIAFVTGGMYDQGPYLPSASGLTAQAQTPSDTQADEIGKVTFEAGDAAIVAAVSPVDSSSDEAMSGVSTPNQNDPLMDAAFAMLSSQEQSSTERKKAALLIL
jgi:autotransporter-associated beta strand protein